MKKLKTIQEKPEPMISGPSLAQLLEIHDATVRRYRRMGMPCHQFNSKFVRYRLSEVEAWLSGNRG